jgi:lipopolysaccharide biosynthesis protein
MVLDMGTAPKIRLKSAIGKLKRATYNSKELVAPGNIKELLIQTKQYSRIKLQAKQVNRSPDSKTAVLIHLYYIESWPLFIDRLKFLDKPYDLFITLPAAHIDFIATINRDYPAAYVFETPNRGRDVLPFIQIAPTLLDKGYEYVLKLHSKKSSHRTDGSEWLVDIVNSLLPDDRSTLDDLFDTLQKKDTGIVGPENQYLSLVVNFEANGVVMSKVINRIYSKSTSYKVLQAGRSDHGFFAGTMFWARLDAFKPIIDNHFGISNFQKESGQIDATFAHGLERVFSLIPEIEGRNMYEIGRQGIKKIAYKTDNIPDWSKVYIGPKPKV